MLDFAGLLQGKMLLEVTDAHSKWPEVVVVTSTTAARTMEALRELLACFGIPRQLVSNNGPQFISREFASFLDRMGVKHIKTAPYHPASNDRLLYPQRVLLDKRGAIAPFAPPWLRH